MDALFRLLGDETRLRVLYLLSTGVYGVGEIAETLGLAQNLVSHHLRALSDGELIRSDRQGRMVFYRLQDTGSAPEAAPVLSHFLNWAAARPPFSVDRERGGRVLGRRPERSRSFFARHADRWDGLAASTVDVARSKELLAQLLPPSGNGIAADLGTGTGSLVPWLSGRFERVIAVDASREMLNLAERNHAGPRTEFRLGELEHLPLPDVSLDAAVMHYVLHHCARPEAVFPEVRRVLRPGGAFVLFDFLPHREEKFRVEMGDVWLGFSLGDIEPLFVRNGFRLDPPMSFSTPSPALEAFALKAVRCG
ncbi:MAG: metalloregulator ArsR/SmtB family transcription factor [Acidobacteria bacterium]|nr:metalloregulator ArsR/SmtB family transcription factor [Acidobacteriota bacterium]